MNYDGGIERRRRESIDWPLDFTPVSSHKHNTCVYILNNTAFHPLLSVFITCLFLKEPQYQKNKNVSL